MLLLASTDIVRIVTGSAATIDVHSSWVDLTVATGAATLGRANVAVASATTSTIVASPAAGTLRKVKGIRIRNRHASLSCNVTIQHYDGTTSVEIDKRALGPGASIFIGEDGAVLPLPTGGAPTPTWYGKVLGAYGNCIPGDLLAMVQGAGVVSATPTNITASVARCSLFRPPCDIAVNRIRAYGVGLTTSVYRVAIYRWSDLARLTAELAFSTAANTWVSIGSALNVALSKDALYFIACSVNAVGTTAGVACMGATIAATTGQIATAPDALPGGLSAGSGYLDGYQFQFAVTTGALPTPAATPAAQAAWTGGMPAFWLDNADV